MFKYKSATELAAMTEVQVEAYMAEKKTYEDGLRAKEIKDAVDAVKAEAKTATDLAVKAAKEEAIAASKTITDDLAQQIQGLKEQSGKATSQKDGIIVEFFKKNITENPKCDTDKKYSAKTTIKAAALINYGTKAAALMTTADVMPNVEGGFSPLFGNYIDYEIGHIPLPDMIFMGLVSVKNAPGTEMVWFSDRVNEQGDAAFIAEGTLKPLISAQWQTTSKVMKEVASRWKQSKRLMLHAPSVISDFAERANMFMEEKIDDEILSGVSGATDFDGLQAVGTAFIVPSTLANYYTYVNIFDVIMACGSQIRQANFKGQLTACLNMSWMAKMQGVKDSLGNYIIPPFVTKDGQTVGEIKVTFSVKVAVGDIIVGVLSKYNLVIAEEISYDEGYENTDFSDNLVSKKLEAFMTSYVKLSDAGAIIYDQIATIQTAIAVPAV